MFKRKQRISNSAMKYTSTLILLCLFAITSANNVEEYHHSTHPRFFNPNAVIRQGFEMLRWLIKNGSRDIIPVMDPWEFEYRIFHIGVPNKLLTLNGSFTNAILTGLGNFEVIEAEFLKTDIAVDLSINFPLLTFTAEQYEMAGNIYQAIPLAGYGSFELEIKNFNLKSKIFLTQSDDGQSVVLDKFLNPEFSIEAIQSRTEFDDNIDEIFNTLIEDLLADYLTRFSKLILKKYLGNVAESVNPFLNQFETWNIIAAIL